MIRSALLRARYLNIRHGAVFASALVLVGVLSLGGAGWLYTHPPTTQVTDQTHQQTIQSNISTQAVVAENSTLYEPRQTLKNQPVYLRPVTPSPTLVQTTSVPENQRVTVSQRMVLTYRADRDDETFWMNSTTIKQSETTTRSGRVRMRSQIDLDAIQTRVQELEETIGDAGTVSIDLRLAVTYTTDKYNGTLAEPIDIRITDEWYQIGSPTVSRTHSTPVTSTVTVPSRQQGTYTGLGILGVVSLLLGIAIGIVFRVESRKLDTADLDHELHRLRYAAWISTGTIPDDAGETVVRVASLEELVDIGIDTDNRTIYDPSRDRYAIFDGSTSYYYDRFQGS